jgi:hypothetical protein
VKKQMKLPILRVEDNESLGAKLSAAGVRIIEESEFHG